MEATCPSWTLITAYQARRWHRSYLWYLTSFLQPVATVCSDCTPTCWLQSVNVEFSPRVTWTLMSSGICSFRNGRGKEKASHVLQFMTVLLRAALQARKWVPAHSCRVNQISLVSDTNVTARPLFPVIEFCLLLFYVNSRSNNSLSPADVLRVKWCNWSRTISRRIAVVELINQIRCSKQKRNIIRALTAVVMLDVILQLSPCRHVSVRPTDRVVWRSCQGEPFYWLDVSP
jgi:hypothetical protein